MKNYDLVVAGGGLSGVAAALAAAREGLRVLLVEKSNCLGGAAVNCLVNPFMPYWMNQPDTDGKPQKNYLSRGIFRQILDELSACSALDRNEITFQEEYLKLILNRLVKKAGVDLLFHSCLIDAALEPDHENGDITGAAGSTLQFITVAVKSGLMSPGAAYFIDATGDADLAVLSGCPFHIGRDGDHLCQPMTLSFRVANVDLEAYKKAKPQINILYQELQKQGKIKNPREDVLIFPTMINGVLHFNSTRIVRKNPTDAFDITDAEIDAREQVFELLAFLKENIDGFQKCQLIMTAGSIGVRESRMIDGTYTLTADDLMACTRFSDSIAAGNYDIDIHNPEGSGTSHYYFPEGQSYTIPYRSLQPRGVKNLLAAGRCISATHEAQASIRIMPICCCLGEAAGTAVAVAFKDRLPVQDIDVRKVQDILRKNGAVI